MTLAALLLAALAGDTYVVAPDGDDAHPGTEEKLWKTLARASGAVKPGDTVRIKAGAYTGGRFRPGPPEFWKIPA